MPELAPVLVMLDEVATAESGTPVFADLCAWWDRHGITDPAEQATWHELAKAVIHERAQLRSEEIERMREEAEARRA